MKSIRWHKLLLAGWIIAIASWMLLPQSSLAGSNREEWRDVTDQYVGYSRIWSDRDTAIANGTDTIKVMGGYYLVGPECPEAPCYRPPSDTAYRINVSGSGNTVTPAQISSGDVVFSITSTTAETKTVTIQNAAAYGEWGFDISIQISFTAPPTVSTADTVPQAETSTPASTSSTPKAVAPVIAKPEAPTLSTVNGQVLSDGKNLSQKISSGEPITFSGKTSANAKVKLYIYSDPITVEVVADQDGFWSYTLAGSLEAGQHRVEAEVTDSSGVISDRVEIAKFSVSAETASAASTSDSPGPTESSVFTPLNYALAGATIVLIVLLAFLLIRKRKRSKNLAQEQQS